MLFYIILFSFGIWNVDIRIILLMKENLLGLSSNLRHGSSRVANKLLHNLKQLWIKWRHIRPRGWSWKSCSRNRFSRERKLISEEWKDWCS